LTAAGKAERTMKRSDYRDKTSLLLEGPIGSTLIRLAMPMVFGMAAIILFNVVDTLYVGRLGALDLAAMSFTFPVVFMVMHVGVGLGVGVTSAISRAIGKGDNDRVRRLTTDGLFLANTVVIVFAIAGILTLDPLFRALGAGEEMLPLIRSYMRWLYVGVGFLVIPIVGNSAIRATGDTKTPAMIMVTAGVVNIALDPLLIFGPGPFPRLELQGAAIATVISWIVTFIAAFWILGKRMRMIDRSLPQLAIVWSSWRAILYVGIPASATQVLVPVAAGIITRMVSSFGPDAVAAFGVGTRIEALALIGIFSLGAALAPFVGQNYGAHNSVRLRKAMRFCAVGAIVYGGAAYVVLALLARPVAILFNDQEAVVATIVTYLRIMPIGYAFHGFALLVVSTFNAVNKPITSAVLNIFRLFVFGLPLAYTGSILIGVSGVFYGLITANVLIGIISYLVMRKFLHIVESEIAADRQIATA
jgi:putative MATE family efflux protein